MNENHLHVTCAIIKQDGCVLAAQVPERLQTFTSETRQALTFGRFIQHHEYELERLLESDTWTGWKARAQLAPAPSDPDLAWLKRSLVKAAFISGPGEIRRAAGNRRAPFQGYQGLCLADHVPENRKRVSPTTAALDSAS